MSIQWKDGKVERLWDGNAEWVDEIIDALDEVVAELQGIFHATGEPGTMKRIAATLRRLGVLEAIDAAIAAGAKR